MRFKINYYLIKLQYLGFRYHGWQYQPGLKTIEGQIRKTLRFVLPDIRAKVIASGRTDAMVSVEQTYIELFVYEADLPEDFFENFNANLPPDIRALSIERTDSKFNVITQPKIKEYVYVFSKDEKFHPFCAPLMIQLPQEIDLELMKVGASLFEGKHDFYSYTFRPKPTTDTNGEIETCEIVKNDLYQANFFPDESYLLRVRGKGFKRHQIRLMMGVLIDLGLGKIDVDFLKETLDGSKKIKLEHIAQASGLLLRSVELK